MNAQVLRVASTTDDSHHPIADREFLMHYGRLRPDEIRVGVQRLARAMAARPRRAIA